METRAHHILIGAFSLLVVIGAVLFSLWIGKVRFDEEFDEYDVVFDQAVSGLSTGAAVQFNGIQVGEVRHLGLAANDPRQVIARIRVQGGLPVTEQTRAQLALTGLTGLAVIRLTGTEPGPPLAPGEGQVPVIRSEPSDLDRLFEGSQDVISNVAETLARINRMLSDENLAKIDGTLSELQALSGQLGNEVGSTLDQARQAGAAIRDLADRAQALIAQLEQSLSPGAIDRLSTSATNTLAEIRSASQQLKTTLESAQRDLDRVGEGSLPQLETSLMELRTMSRQLTRLARQLDQSPQQFLQQPPAQRTEDHP